MKKSFSVYGDDSNHTVCLRGDIEETYWSGELEDEDVLPIRDVVAISDGTILELYHDAGNPLFRIRALKSGSALQEIRRYEDQSDEAFIEGEIAWVMVAAKSELLDFDGS